MLAGGGYLGLMVLTQVTFSSSIYTVLLFK